MSDYIQTTINDDIFEIVLNRPKKLNAISLEMMAAVKTAVSQATRTSGLRALTIRGNGPSFSAGIDITSFMQLAEEWGSDWQHKMRAITDDLQQTFTQIERLELPTIAILHGHCLGLGLELALACDLRFAAAGTKLALPETRLGLIPDVGGTTRLVRVAGVARAKELIFTGKQITAEQAQQYGILNAVAPQDHLQATVNQFIAELRHAAPLAVGMAKRVIDGLADIDRGLQLEGWAQSQLVQSDDFTEAIQAFITKRPPNFKGK